ncbi:MAG: NFACT family protein, partial [Candidatus Cloacimonetes bacterium]|nr:NFACT family protein [Candidatus Cloacimonadota bacterium]
MKYFMLAQWVAEHNNLKSVINRIYKVRDAVVIRFESGRYLVFHYLTNAPLLYVTDKVNYDLKNAQTIWTNLQNAIVSSVSISENDRIITFSLSHKDIYQKVNEYCLIYECMPPKANLILCREQSGILLISDAVVKYTYADNPQRQILAGLPYEPPRTAFKPDFSKLSYPIILKLPEQDKDIACQSVNEYFIAYQKYIVEKQEATLQKKRLENRWNKALHKAEKKLQLQQQELEQAELESTWLLYSELLKVNLQNVRKGDDCLLTTNYYDSNLTSISIPLFKEKSPQENLNFYLKKYRKAKQGKEKLASQIK